MLIALSVGMVLISVDILLGYYCPKRGVFSLICDHLGTFVTASACLVSSYLLYKLAFGKMIKDIMNEGAEKLNDR